ncbi:hypothetical protein DCAR_0310558 [Daucus carota subsp. sativus]|uniref:Uncharacterized protein n=1 Tax=Daucus carota subsp. sativus TaxID=79200 RepID=A0A165ZZK4_DAUCS|nr:hypothetical protein DCAR_0310558 [Daucus carota subsp. sativus]
MMASHPSPHEGHLRSFILVGQPYIRVGVYGGEVDFFDQMVADVISPNLIARIELFLLRHRVPVEAFHADRQQVLLVDRFHETCHFLNPSIYGSARVIHIATGFVHELPRHDCRIILVAFCAFVFMFTDEYII